jgi:hypothetical protein
LDRREGIIRDEINIFGSSGVFRRSAVSMRRLAMSCCNIELPNDWDAKFEFVITAEEVQSLLRRRRAECYAV